MGIRRNLFTLAIAAAAIGPTVAVAASEFHRVDGEIGYTQHRDHVKPSNVARAQVIAEINSAQMQGVGQRDVISTSKNVGPSKTREQVSNEMRTNKDWRTRTGIYWGGK